MSYSLKVNHIRFNNDSEYAHALKGDKGDKGDSYNLTTADKTEIAGKINADTDRRLVNLEAAAQGKIYTGYTDSTAARIKTVPANALPWASVDSIGGKCENVDGDILIADVSGVKVVGQRETTHAIPSAVRSLTGYGWSAGTAYNEVDIENKKYIQRVGKIHITDASVSHKFSTYYYLFFNVDDALKPSEGSSGVAIASNGLTYIYGYKANGFFFTNGKIVYGTELSNTWETVDDLKSYLAENPYDIYYKLANPIETDISDLLTWDGSINVEAGGTVEFVNGNNLSIPSNISYLTKVVSDE